MNIKNIQILIGLQGLRGTTKVYKWCGCYETHARVLHIYPRTILLEKTAVFCMSTVVSFEKPRLTTVFAPRLIKPRYFI
jgi:hypothetical protein